MAVEIHDQPVPLRVDGDGVIRVGGTRVTLNTIVTAFELGLGAEEIADRYPAVTLADVYSTIGYYLQHRTTLDQYLREHRAATDHLRDDIERRSRQQELRARLLARRHAGQ